ncbi:hypothetical protein AKJ65_03460 [candidate division MSBL1 archaeon SCGC-AAA259E19]|uniref:Ubiquitin Mut7-C domain-containing protein n=1 Tax=candidate division MSBL1 archaeon SCGC-AAA259E19 TaxID=1698264 RepID=A0A133UKM4_9EURY|nr:hypothetical protein AKJ65_03460 [candidate division MSBL1 archaeon SCGC-AAA259E19]
MTSEIRLYGEFKDKAYGKGTIESNIGIINMERESFGKISEVLDFLNIKKERTSHIFLNGEYSSYERKIPEKDSRIAIFPREMALLYKWYFSPKE